MDLQKLKQEITDDPLGRGYANLSPYEIAESLNAVNRTRQEPVPVVEMLIWAAQTRAIPRFRALAAGGPPLDGMGEVALVIFTTLGIPLGLDYPEVAGLLAVLVGAGAFTQEEVDALAARSQFPVSRAEELGLEPVTGQAVIDASYA